MQGCAARLRAIAPKAVPQARSVRRSGLPEALGTSAMSILASVGCYMLQRSLRVTPSLLLHVAERPAVRVRGPAYHYLKAPARLGELVENLGAQEVWGTTSTNGPGTQ